MDDVSNELNAMEEMMYQFSDAGDFRNARDCWLRWKGLRQHPSCNRMDRMSCNWALDMSFVMEQLELIGERALAMHALHSEIRQASALLDFDEAIQLRARWDVTYPNTMFPIKAPDEYTDALQMYVLRFDCLMRQWKQEHAHLVNSLTIANDEVELQRGLRIQRLIEQHNYVFKKAKAFGTGPKLCEYKRFVQNTASS